MDNNIPILSFIVPMKNMEKYIDKCIKSIIHQTIENIEVIIIDFGSTDRSIEIVESINDSRIKIIKKCNCDVVDARNYGIDRAIGKYIGFVDADDYIDKEFTKRMINNLESSNIDIVICAYQCCDEISGKITYKSEFLNNIYFLDRKNIYEFLLKSAMGIVNLEIWNKIYKLDFIRKNQVKLDNIYSVTGEDILFNYSLYLNFPKVKIISDILYTHLNRENSLGKIIKKDITQRLSYIIDNISKNVENKGIINETMEVISVQYLSLLIFQIANAQKMNLKYKQIEKENLYHTKYIDICAMSNSIPIKYKALAKILKYKLNYIFYIYIFLKKEKK